MPSQYSGSSTWFYRSCWASAYAGETGYDAMLGFIIGMAGWAYILYEIFLGEAGQVASEQAPESVQSAFVTMRWIVTIGWAIYPIGYFMGYFTGAGPEASANAEHYLQPCRFC